MTARNMVCVPPFLSSSNEMFVLKSSELTGYSVADRGGGGRGTSILERKGEHENEPNFTEERP